ncbi:MAG TPA: type II toxin-antitoxin system RelE/ParE family toxin [Planctomycetota bacterium]|nr:type II toxin-antitoxin system RelE/ParE family toxin [Planctomycetota bacterium]
MPRTRILLFREANGRLPVREWLAELGRRDPKAAAKCVDRVERLAAMGFELRRPEADLLRDGIFELRIRRGHVNLRILYFFHGKDVAVLAHALTKEEVVPEADIRLAWVRRRLVEEDPRRHLHGDES